MSNEETSTQNEPQKSPVEATGEGFVMLMGNVEKAIEKSKNSLIALHKSARSATAPALGKAKITLSFGARKGRAGLKSFFTETVKPGLQDALGRDALKQKYNSALLLAHRFTGDRKLEKHCFVRTNKPVKLSVLRIPHQLRRAGHDYYPTPVQVFHWAMSGIEEPVNRFAFVDYGAGLGRSLLLASHYPFEMIRGAEIAQELHQDCKLNIAQFPRSLMKCRDVDCEHLSALRLNVPAQETVFLLHNPFDKEMTERVVEQITKSYRQDPRRMYMLFVDMDAGDIMQESGIFEPVAMPWKLRLKTRLFSPYPVSVYRTIL